MAEESHHTYSVIHFVIRLIPSVPSWLLNQTYSFFPVNYAQFALAVALGYLPYNWYTVALGAQLNTLTECDVDDIHHQHFKLSFALMVAIVLAVSVALYYSRQLVEEVTDFVQSICRWFAIICNR